MGLCGNFADISFWDWRQYETIAYIINLSWIRFISIKNKSKWMHFELSIHWRLRVLSRSIYLAQNYAGHSWSDEWGTFLDEKFAFRVFRNRSLPFVISGGSRPWAKEAGGGGGGGGRRFFCRLGCWVPPSRSSNGYRIAFNSLWQSPAFLDLCRCSEEKATLWRKLKNCKNVFS